LMLNLNQMAEKIEEDVEMSVHIDRTADDAQIKVLGKQIEQIDQVDTVVFSSKEDELKNLIKSMGEEGESWELFEQDNPLSHAFIVQAKNPNETESIASKIETLDRKSTRLNSSHVSISYAVFCLKK